MSQFTLAELTGSRKVVYRGTVLDLPEQFTEVDHPGGQVFGYLFGKDITSTFDDVGHSDLARELLNEFAVGTLAIEHPTEELKGKQ